MIYSAGDRATSLDSDTNKLAEDFELVPNDPLSTLAPTVEPFEFRHAPDTARYTVQPAETIQETSHMTLNGTRIIAALGIVAAGFLALSSTPSAQKTSVAFRSASSRSKLRGRPRCAIFVPFYRVHYKTLD